MIFQDPKHDEAEIIYRKIEYLNKCKHRDNNVYDNSYEAYRNSELIFEALKPMNVMDGEKITIGGKNMLEPQEYADNKGIVYSLGVNHYSSWDMCMANKGYRVYQYDGIAYQSSEEHPFIYFNRYNIVGINPDVHEKTISQIVSEREHNGKNIILQIDIKGWEWGIFEHISREDMLCFDQIIVTFHKLKATGTRFQKIISILNKINKTHQSIHMHGNNYSGATILQGLRLLPEAVEVTYVRKETWRKFEPCFDIFPGELDSPKDQNTPDIFLGRFNFPEQPSLFQPNTQTSKKPLVFVLVAEQGKAFVAANVALSLNRHMPFENFDILIYHNGLAKTDEIAFLQIKNVILEKFSGSATFICYQIFDLLDRYKQAVWLDSNASIQTSVISLCDYGPLGMGANLHNTGVYTVREDFSKPMLDYDMDADAYCCAVITVNELLENYREIYDWLQTKSAEFIEYLKNPAQGMINLMLQEFKLNVNVFRYEEFLSSTYSEKANVARIVQFGSKDTPWNISKVLRAFPEWHRSLIEWRRLGGGGFKTTLDNRNILFDKPLPE